MNVHHPGAPQSGPTGSVEHTPGPWHLAGTTVYWIGPRTLDHLFIAQVGPERAGASPEVAANAHLIAAAPDLLETVKMLHGVLEHEPRTYGGELYKTSASREVVLEVLAKAEGRQP